MTGLFVKMELLFMYDFKKNQTFQIEVAASFLESYYKSLVNDAKSSAKTKAAKVFLTDAEILKDVDLHSEGAAKLLAHKYFNRGYSDYSENQLDTFSRDYPEIPKIAEGIVSHSQAWERLGQGQKPNQPAAGWPWGHKKLVVDVPQEMGSASILGSHDEDKSEERPGGPAAVAQGMQTTTHAIVSPAQQFADQGSAQRAPSPIATVPPTENLTTREQRKRNEPSSTGSMPNRQGAKKPRTKGPSPGLQVREVKQRDVETMDGAFYESAKAKSEISRAAKLIEDVSKMPFEKGKAHFEIALSKEPNLRQRLSTILANDSLEEFATVQSVVDQIRTSELVKDALKMPFEEGKEYFENVLSKEPTLRQHLSGIFANDPSEDVAAVKSAVDQNSSPPPATHPWTNAGFQRAHLSAPSHPGDPSRNTSVGEAARWLIDLMTFTEHGRRTDPEYQRSPEYVGDRAKIMAIFQSQDSIDKDIIALGNKMLSTETTEMRKFWRQCTKRVEGRGLGISDSGRGGEKPPHRQLHTAMTEALGSKREYSGKKGKEPNVPSRRSNRDDAASR